MPVTCSSSNCNEPAQPEHDPCCSAHQRPLCCAHYNRLHHIEVHRCTPAQHARTVAR